MSNTKAIAQFIEKVLVDTDFHDQLIAAPDQAARLALLASAGIDVSFTQAELDAEVARLKQAAGALAHLEDTVVGDAAGAHARWVSRLANLGDRVADAAMPA